MRHQRQLKIDLKQFSCIQCHACCRQPGYVRLKKAEPDAIANFLQMDVRRFINSFTLLTDDRTSLSLMEQDGGACVFLTEHGCRIQPVKPEQCRDFPRKWRFSGFKKICGWARAQAGKDL
ncbi:MAG: YkgJ family cysteine cluster protein [Desulfotignum sp.]|nr:YkgJ family cysteine cluster protein [Desulfotignum sp.]MCF8113753.1 YkgJ family cysteine cluster protein [Desulfotignum sp.]